MRPAIWGFVLMCIIGVGLIRSAGPNLASVGAASVDQRVREPEGLVRLGAKAGRWTPFSANLRRVIDPGAVAVGRFYRASDGSTRSETGPSTGDITIVGIKNMSERIFYLWLPASGWESHPMELPPGGYFQPRVDDPLSVGARRVDDQIEGIDLIKSRTDRAGVTEYQAPRLNFFALKMTMPCKSGEGTGCGLWHSEINIDEQPAELFKPPAGVPIVKRSEPGGIVRGSTLFGKDKQ